MSSNRAWKVTLLSNVQRSFSIMALPSGCFDRFPCRCTPPSHLQHARGLFDIAAKVGRSQDPVDATALAGGASAATAPAAALHAAARSAKRRAADGALGVRAFSRVFEVVARHRKA